MSETIYDGNLKKYLPQALANDVDMNAFAELLSEKLLEVSKNKKNVLIYP